MLMSTQYFILFYCLFSISLINLSLPLVSIYAVFLFLLHRALEQKQFPPGYNKVFSFWWFWCFLIEKESNELYVGTKYLLAKIPAWAH